MRQIKFRGLCVRRKIWVYGYYAVFTGKHIIYVGWTAYEVTPESVGQFTGLHDKYGVEIYEGDIIKYDGIEGIVSFDDSMFQVRFEYTRSIHVLGNLDREIEVIGNIHTQDGGQEG